MQKYKYTALNVNKKKFTGTFLAENEEHLRALLAQQNLYLIDAKPISDTTPNAFFSVSGKVKLAEITNFCRQFSILTNAGISIVESLSILKTQSYSSLFKKVLEMVHEDVKAGMLLSEALNKHEKIFPDFFRSMAYVGEMSGSLDTVLVELANYYEMDDRMKRKTKSAFSYPIVLICMLVGVVAVMMVFVIPNFRGALASLNVEMPGITMAIFNISQFFIDNWMILILSIVALIAGIAIFKKTPPGRMFFDTLAIKMPIVKNININLVTSRFTHGFGLLLASGMDIVDAMDVMLRVFGNVNVEARFKQASEEVRRGRPLTLTLDAYELFPQMLIQMVSVGEKTGALDEVLLKIAKYYDEQVELALGAISTVIQPVLLCAMGAIIAIMFIAVYSPMLSIMQNLG